MAQIADVGGGKSIPLNTYPEELLTDKSDGEWMDILKKEFMERPRRDQRADDTGRDLHLRFFSRQKHRSVCTICCALIWLTLIHVIQGVALYNLQISAVLVKSIDVTNWIEDGRMNTTLGVDVGIANSRDLLLDVRQITAVHNLKVDENGGGSEIHFLDLVPAGFCWTPYGAWQTIFNVGSGLLMVYAFIFADLWETVMDTPLARSFPHEPKGKLMLVGEFWLVLVNATILTWMGIVSGLTVLGRSGSFFDVVESALAVWVILRIDDVFLPALRYVFEEMGHLDEEGELSSERLKLLTHGMQYYKPGYISGRGRKVLSQPNPILKIIGMVALVLLAGIIFVPVTFIVIQAGLMIKVC